MDNLSIKIKALFSCFCSWSLGASWNLEDGFEFLHHGNNKRDAEGEASQAMNSQIKAITVDSSTFIYYLTAVFLLVNHPINPDSKTDCVKSHQHEPRSPPRVARHFWKDPSLRIHELSLNLCLSQVKSSTKFHLLKVRIETQETRVISKQLLTRKEAV
jgi:hypothetical protein